MDDLDDIARLEEHIQHSDVVVIILTQDYVTSKNCRREVAEMLRANKPLVILREMDANHGAVTLEELKEECERVPADERATAMAVCTASEDAELTLEWHRENHLKQAVLANVMQRILATTGVEDVTDEASAMRKSNRAISSGETSNSAGRDRPADPARGASRAGNIQLAALMSRRMRSATIAARGSSVKTAAVDAVFLSPLYARCPLTGGREGRSVLSELSERFEEAGVKVVSARAEGSPVVIALFPGVFDRAELVQEWTELLTSGEEETTQIIPLFFTAWSFASYFSACPDSLRQLGFFAPLFQKWPNGLELQRAAVAFAVTHKSPLPRQARRSLAMPRISRPSQGLVAANVRPTARLRNAFRRRPAKELLPELTREAVGPASREAREKRLIHVQTLTV